MKLFRNSNILLHKKNYKKSDVKHIVLFSGGASSSYLAKMVIDKYGKENTILLHTPTYSEDPDADRFRMEVANYLDMEITEEIHGMDLWELIEKNNALPSHFLPFCTTQLKIVQSRKFFKRLQKAGIKFCVHFGYGRNEWRRIQKQMVRFQMEGIESEYLIFEKNIDGEEIKRIIKEEWGIPLPRAYKYLKHNNCIPCFKGGKSHFKKVAKYYPLEFKKAVEAEKRMGHTVFKDCTLEDLWDVVEREKKQISMEDLIEEEYEIPCMCGV